ncbi:MAG: GNAT family N-acetyltransferase, partial [Alphaproteobacteria bacterium]|nr:GNAT family N-acetyltransferase [Alphaproteobacteria bacterium]
MIRIVKYTSQDKKIWNDFISSSKNGTFMLNRDFMDYHADRFHDFSLMFYKKETLIALLPASLHGTELRSHGGLTYGGLISNKDLRAVD